MDSPRPKLARASSSSSLSLPASMRALVREHGRVNLVELPTPRALAPDQVLLRIELAGVCRTDCFVADGRLATGVERRVLGHEVAGVVVAGGAAAQVSLGAVASVDPRMPCEVCAACKGGATGQPRACAAPRFLGVDIDGGFAEYLRVPAASLVLAPANLDLRAVAYIEPIAATLAVVQAGIEPSQTGVVVGSGRIAELTARVLALRGFGSTSSHDPARDPARPSDSVDFAIETQNDEASLAAMVAMVRPGGRIVLKSRTVTPLVFNPLALIRKRLQLHAVDYGSFTEAAALLPALIGDLAPLWTTPRSLDDYARVLDEGRRSEGRKLFFAIRQGHGHGQDQGRGPEHG